MAEPIEKRIEQIETRLQRIEERLNIEPVPEAEITLEPWQAEPMRAEDAAPMATPIAPMAMPVAPIASAVPPLATPVAPIAIPAAMPVVPAPANPQETDERGYPLTEVPVAKHASPPPLPVREAPTVDARPQNVEQLWQSPAPQIRNPQSKIQNPIEPVLPYVSPTPPRPQKQGTLEQAIGLKWAGWVGAVILLIGAALGVKYAFDQHWFAAMPIWIWPSIIAACGFALIGAGEYVYRKVNVVPAASLFGAGIATLFLVSYVGHSYYALYSPTTAFALMGLTTLIGSAVAMRGKMVSIAVLSLIGGNIAPLVMGDTGAPHSTFMAYLLMLQAIALVLAWWGRSRRWWMLRGLSLATTALWTLAIVASHRDGMMPLGFAIVYAVLYHAEVIASALLADRDPEKSRTLQHGGTTFVVLVMAGLTAAILSVLHDATPFTRALWLLSEAAACLVLRLSLRNPDRRITRSLVPAYGACEVALLLLAVPVAFNGMSIEIGWALMAIAMAIVGRSTKSGISQAGSIVAWLCALLHLILSTSNVDVLGHHHVATTWMTINGVAIASTTFIAWGLALVGHLVAGLNRTESEDSKVVSTSLGLIATIVFVAASILALPPLGATVSLVAFAWALLVADVPAPRMNLAMQAIGVLLLATVKWVVIDTLAQRLSPDWSATQYAPILNPLMGVGLLLAGSLVGAYWLRRGSIKLALPDQRHAPLAATVAGVVVALVAIAFSFEIDRVVEQAVASGHALSWPAWQLKQMAWTMLWSLCATVLAWVLSRMSALGVRRSNAIGAIAAFAMLMVGKFVIIDTLIYRVTQGAGSAMVLLNLQTLTALVVVGSVVLIRMALRSVQSQAEQHATIGSKLHLLALFVVAWTGTFEIERFILLHPAIVSPWPIYQFKQMAWTMWWTICAASGFVLGWRFDRTAHAQSGWPRLLSGAIAMLAVKFIVADALFWRLTDRVTLAPVVANVQTLTAAVLIGAMIAVMWLGLPAESEFSRPMRVRTGFLAWILALLAISLEIDRFFEGSRATGLLTDPRLAKQVAFSITWSIFAVLSVAAGFKIRLASLRYFGLGLLAVTLLKVVTVDLGQVSTGYRILSFLGLGLLMLGTSVLYGKLSPKLLGAPESA